MRFILRRNLHLDDALWSEEPSVTAKTTKLTSQSTRVKDFVHGARLWGWLYTKEHKRFARKRSNLSKNLTRNVSSPDNHRRKATDRTTEPGNDSAVYAPTGIMYEFDADATEYCSPVRQRSSSLDISTENDGASINSLRSVYSEGNACDCHAPTETKNPRQKSTVKVPLTPRPPRIAPRFPRSPSPPFGSSAPWAHPAVPLKQGTLRSPISSGVTPKQITPMETAVKQAKHVSGPPRKPAKGLTASQVHVLRNTTPCSRKNKPSLQRHHPNCFEPVEPQKGKGMNKKRKLRQRPRLRASAESEVKNDGETHAALPAKQSNELRSRPIGNKGTRTAHAVIAAEHISSHDSFSSRRKQLEAEIKVIEDALSRLRKVALGDESVTSNEKTIPAGSAKSCAKSTKRKITATFEFEMDDSVPAQCPLRRSPSIKSLPTTCDIANQGGGHFLVSVRRNSNSTASASLHRDDASRTSRTSQSSSASRKSRRMPEKPCTSNVKLQRTKIQPPSTTESRSANGSIGSRETRSRRVHKMCSASAGLPMTRKLNRCDSCGASVSMSPLKSEAKVFTNQRLHALLNDMMAEAKSKDEYDGAKPSQEGAKHHLNDLASSSSSVGSRSLERIHHLLSGTGPSHSKASKADALNTPRECHTPSSSVSQ